MASHVLITGASGLIGTRLTQMLLENGHIVSHLSRSPKDGPVPSFAWDVKRNFIDPKALEDVDAIIHLAGAGVSDKRWNAAWKKEILESRTHSTRLLFNTLSKSTHSVRTFISASAIGYYGFTLTDKEFNEESLPGNDFLAQVVKEWEAEADHIAALGIRLSKIRVGVVLSREGGALKQMAMPVRLWLGAPLGSGKQYVSWIHIDDMCGIFIKALEDEKMSGVYNGVSPHAVTNAELTKAIAKVLHKPLWAPAVPAFLLRMILGEMADIVVNGSNVSAQRIQDARYVFKFENVVKAVEDLG